MATFDIDNPPVKRVEIALAYYGSQSLFFDTTTREVFASPARLNEVPETPIRLLIDSEALDRLVEGTRADHDNFAEAQRLVIDHLHDEFREYFDIPTPTPTTAHFTQAHNRLVSQGWYDEEV